MNSVRLHFFEGMSGEMASARITAIFCASSALEAFVLGSLPMFATTTGELAEDIACLSG